MSGDSQPVAKIQGYRTASASKKRPERPSLSCTECRRRKQKCNQGKPCSNCLRRFPQPICEYEVANSRNKRSGNRSSEEPDLAVTHLAGPYSHLRLTGLEDAILHLEMPSEAADENEADGGIQALHELGLDMSQQWRPLRVTTKHDRIANASKKMWDTVNKILLRRLVAAGQITAEDINMNTKKLLEAADGSVPAPRPVGKAADGLRQLPMAPTKLNKELARTHLQMLCRFKACMDGDPGADNGFMCNWVPFCVQDPLALKVILYTAACFLTETGHVPKMVSISYKSTLYSSLNQSLADPAVQCSDSVIATVTQLIVDEWYWGTTSALKAHMHGLKRIISMRGGLQSLGLHGYLAKMILIDDIAIALAHETEPFIFDQPDFEFEDPVMVPLQTSLNTPLMTGWPSFEAGSTANLISPSTAFILDNMRLLIDTVLAGLKPDLSLEEPRKISSTAFWIQQQIEDTPCETYLAPKHPTQSASSDQDDSSSPSQSSPSQASTSSTPQNSNIEIRGAPDLIYRWVRMSARIFCRAIVAGRPLSEVCSQEELLKIWYTYWNLSGIIWRAVLGVTFWTLIAIAPSCHGLAPGRFIKTFLTMALMNIGMDNWHVAIDTARRALKLQAYLRGGLTRGLAVYGGEHTVQKHGWAVKEWLPILGLTPLSEEADGD